MIQSFIDKATYFLFYLLMTQALTGCAAKIIKPIDPMNHNGRIIEKEFLPHVLTFEKYYGKPISIQITFRQLDDLLFASKNILGICRCFYFCPEEERSIEIDIDHWPTLGWEEREELILHELGHCILNRWHDDEEINISTWGIKIMAEKSIMNSYSFGSNFSYMINRGYYIRELFGNKKLTPKE